MATDSTTKLYYEAIGSQGSDSGPYWWKIYHYDATGNTEVVVHRSPSHYRSRDAAINACGEWMDANDVDAELA